MIASNIFLVLQQARHRIKIGYGLSEPVYRYEDKKVPITGIGQGNRLGPALWCFISTIIINTCKSKGHGTTIINPISKMIVALLDFIFVDDADLVTMANNASTFGAAMIPKMQALMMDWCGCIRATGGLILLPKPDGSLCHFSGMAPTLTTKQRTPSPVILLCLIKTESCTPSQGKSLQQPLNP